MSTRVEALETQVAPKSSDKESREIISGLTPLTREEEMAAVRKAQLGDEGSFSRLYEQYRPRVYNYVFARVENFQDAEDVTQEVFLNMASALPRFEFKKDIPFSAWVFRIAHNETVSFRRKEITEDESALKNKPQQDLFSNPPDIVEIRVLAQQALKAASKLSEKQKRVIYLRLIEGLSVSETAQMMGIEKGNVRTVQHKAIARLREILATDGFRDILRTTDQHRNETSTKQKIAFELIEAGTPVEEVVAHLGLARSTLRNYYYKELRLHRLRQRTGV